ncbi:C-type lectin (CTL) or carbohydrate-recognition domain (CRD) [Mactra antiquata]
MTMIYILLLVFIVQIKGDYDCLCSYDVEREVYQTSDTGSTPIGYLYEFDCKLLLTDNPVDGWWKIAFEHQVGYIDKGLDQRIEILVCSGEPFKGDVITKTTHRTLPTTNPSTTIVYTTPTSSTPSTVVMTTVPMTSSLSSVLTSPLTTISTTTSTTPTTTPTTTSTTPTTTTTTPTTTSTTPSTTTTTPTTTSTTPTTTTTTPTTTSTTPTTTTTTPTTTSTTPTTSTTTPTTTSTTPTTTTTTTTKPTTTPIPIIGDVHICPPILSKYTKEDGGNMTQYGNYCYEYVPVKVIWKRAAIDCKAKGGNLIHIGHEPLQTYIYKWINTLITDEPVWLGLHDVQTEGYFEWVSGDPVLFTNFLPGGSLTNDKDDCVHMLASSPYFGVWYDVPCGYQTTHGDVGPKNPFICEYRIDQFQGTAFIG